jgi:hypothetical protein
MSPRLSYFILAVVLIVVAVSFMYGFGFFSERPGFTHVWGHVSYNGKPVPDCAIYFMPADPTRGHWGVGRLSDSGLYFLTAYQLDTTLDPGPYVIFIRPLTPVPIGPAGADSKGQKPKLPLPERFTDSNTSPLVINIDQRPQRVEIHLTD